MQDHPPFYNHVIYIMQRTSGVKYLVIYGKKLRKLPRVFYLPNSGDTSQPISDWSAVCQQMQERRTFSSKLSRVRQTKIHQNREFCLSLFYQFDLYIPLSLHLPAVCRRPTNRKYKCTIRTLEEIIISRANSKF